MRKKIVAGNWKMNGDRTEALGLVTEIRDMYADEISIDVDVIVAPPFVHLGAVSKLLEKSKIAVSAQNCATETSGAYTGEVSASMVSSVGAEYVIIGHSERRTIFNESNDELKKKIVRAHEASLTVIFCVGESKTERDSGAYTAVVKKQLEESLFSIKNISAINTIIAYEPVWAIGTGATASPGQAQEMHEAIRALLKYQYGVSANDFSILYGGSCNETNASELFALPDVDGGLIGGASLKSRSFINIIKSF
jgi:triosephosphate isomerase (TIM)